MKANNTLPKPPPAIQPTPQPAVIHLPTPTRPDSGANSGEQSKPWAFGQLETAIWQACATINLLTTKLCEVMEEHDPDGDLSCPISAGLVQIGYGSIAELREKFNAAHAEIYGASRTNQ